MDEAEKMAKCETCGDRFFIIDEKFKKVRELYVGKLSAPILNNMMIY